MIGNLLSTWSGGSIFSPVSLWFLLFLADSSLSKLDISLGASSGV